MLGSIIGGISSVLGGLFGQKSQDKQMAQQIAAQKEFAQQGIRWKVEDAKAAGIHPLYALGANTASFSPIGVGGSPLAEGLANAGQEIGRAVSAKGTTAERAYNQQMMALQLERGKLENQLLASQIARTNSPTQLPPPMPNAVSGQSSTPGSIIDGQNVFPNIERFGGPAKSLVTNVPLERVQPDPARPWSEGGPITDTGWIRTAKGGYAAVPSKDAAERLEDQLIPSQAWALRNVYLPSISSTLGTPPFRAPKGTKWTYDVLDQSWRLKGTGRKGDRARLPY